MEEVLRDFFANLEMGWLALLCLAGAALLEYLCPPFPGDMVAMVGAFLVGAAGWSAPGVLTAIFLGSALGMTLDYSFGVWVRHRDARWRERHPLWARIGQEVDRTLAIYRKRPRTFLIVNRFLPSVRALFFVAAGMVETPPPTVALYGGLSMVAWALLLFGAGYWLGQDWEALVQFFRGFSQGSWAVVLVAVVAYVLWRWRVRRRDAP